MDFFNRERERLQVPPQSYDRPPTNNKPIYC